ncbi:MAG TPA: trypsin-like peptidase domain-containing protein, partial [Gaiellaceae bacterium]|nr:trypsin-like peptidase domain-containing protein [Gaiellaceae bacterium]
RVVTFVAASAAGAAIAVGIAAAAGDLGTATTTIRNVIHTGSVAAVRFAETARPLTIHQIYERAAPGVVQVTATSRVTTQPNPFLDPFGFGGPSVQTQIALGSGFVIDKTGDIVTNYHVVQGARKVEVSFSDNEHRPATIVGRDPSTDVAVLRVENMTARALSPLSLGDSDRVEVGDAVVAIGNPLGEDRSITAGIVSALQRRIFAPNGAPIDHAIQTDAALNHGNSGGPLLNALGQVIGVDSQIQTAEAGGGSIGIGFAIPINTVKSTAAQLIAHGSVEHAFLGVQVQTLTPKVAKLFRLPAAHGLLVGSVCRKSGAQSAGVRAGTQQVTVAGVTWTLGGDIIVKFDGTPVTSVGGLRSLVADHKPGQTVTLAIYRGSKALTLHTKLGRQPLSAAC